MLETQNLGINKMEMKMLREYIRSLILNEEKKNNLLGEPDTTSEKHRDEPQPQYEEEEADEAEDADEASVVAGIAGYIGPMGASGAGPGNKPYGSNDDEE